MDKSINRQIDKYTNRQIDKQTNSQIDKQTNRQIEKQTNRKIDKYKLKDKDKLKNKHLDKRQETNRQMPDTDRSPQISQNYGYCSKEEEKAERFESVEKKEAQRSDHIFL